MESLENERMESATCCGMESRISEYGIKTEDEEIQPEG